MTTASMYSSASFRAMGTDMTVIAAERPLAADLIKSVQSHFAAEEARFSRFRPDSELSSVNRNGGGPVSQTFGVVLDRATIWHRTTDGDFDPSVLTDLLNAGYDRTFELLGAERTVSSSGLRRGTAMHSFGEIKLSVAGSDQGSERPRDLWMPDGMQIDLSGIVKSWSVDRAAEMLVPAEDFIVDGGGDIVARGDSPDGPGWWVGIEDPFQPGTDYAYIHLTDAAVATSGTYRRRWNSVSVDKAHHIIDPATGKPSNSGVIAATVTGGDAESCEIFARTALIRGPARGLELLEESPGHEGLLTLDDGTRLATSGWPGVTAYRNPLRVAAGAL